MSDHHLPSTVATEKLASQNAELSGTIALSTLHRLVPVLASSEGEANVVLRFAIDEQGRRRVSGTLVCELKIFCQRCLKPMPLAVKSEIDAALVADDEAAQQIPRQLDLVVAEEGVLDVYQFIEDELLLSLPFTSFHEHNCVAIATRGEVSQQPETHKPFADLAAIIDKS
ncbi:MAG: YceD family protein [Pseudomonadales bacterium]